MTRWHHTSSESVDSQFMLPIVLCGISHKITFMTLYIYMLTIIVVLLAAILDYPSVTFLFTSICLERLHAAK